MKINWTVVAPAAIAILIPAGLCAWFWSYGKSTAFTGRGVAHGLPYKWDSYVRPDLQFTLEPMSNVIAKVNEVIRNVRAMRCRKRSSSIPHRRRS